jgi:sodium transport system ATP-binding protein
MIVANSRELVIVPHKNLLDEPTNGLDIMIVRTLRDELRALRAQGKCLLFSSHVMQEVAALCDRIVVIAHGRVVAAGTADELIVRAGTQGLEDAFVALIGSAEGLAA